MRSLRRRGVSSYGALALGTKAVASQEAPSSECPENTQIGLYEHGQALQ
jgi:hypothetical protein